MNQVNKFINMIPDHKQESPHLMPTTDSELTGSLGGAQPGKEDPAMDWVILCKFPKLYGQTY